jgi:hypothetical protein
MSVAAVAEWLAFFFNLSFIVNCFANSGLMLNLLVTAVVQNRTEDKGTWVFHRFGGEAIEVF